MGYSAKEQKNTKPTGIITFQWDSCNGETVKLNSGVIVPSVNTIASYEGDDPVEGWYLNAPKIQIRDSDGGYTIRYIVRMRTIIARGIPRLAGLMRMETLTLRQLLMSEVDFG